MIEYSLEEELEIYAELERIRWPADQWIFDWEERFSDLAWRKEALRPDTPFSAYTIGALKRISEKLPISELEGYCEGWLRRHENEKDLTRKKLTKLRKALDKLDTALEECDLNTTIALQSCGTMNLRDDVQFPEEHEDLKRFARTDELCDGMHLAFFRRDVRTILKLTGLSLATYRPKGGRPPRSNIHLFAFMVARLLGQIGIKVNKYKDGPYFQVLELLLNESMPDLGETAHIRYGESAVDAFLRFKDVPYPDAELMYEEEHF